MINRSSNSSKIRKKDKEPVDTREKMASLPFGARIEELEKMRKRRKKQIKNPTNPSMDAFKHFFKD